jgi:predicted metal-dependent hydrolase
VLPDGCDFESLYKEHNHSKQYYQLLDQTLPNWRERRQKLNRFEF